MSSPTFSNWIKRFPAISSGCFSLQLFLDTTQHKSKTTLTQTSLKNALNTQHTNTSREAHFKTNCMQLEAFDCKTRRGRQLLYSPMALSFIYNTESLSSERSEKGPKQFCNLMKKTKSMLQKYQWKDWYWQQKWTAPSSVNSSIICVGRGISKEMTASDRTRE